MWSESPNRSTPPTSNSATMATASLYQLSNKDGVKVEPLNHSFKVKEDHDQCILSLSKAFELF